MTAFGPLGITMSCFFVCVTVLTYINVLPFGKLQMETLKVCHCSVVLGVHSLVSGELSGNLKLLSYSLKQVCQI